MKYVKEGLKIYVIILNILGKGINKEKKYLEGIFFWVYELFIISRLVIGSYVFIILKKVNVVRSF